MYPNKTVPKPLLALPVIVIMLVILMPELSRLRFFAYRTICGKNLSAIGKVLAVYAADHKEMYPTPSKWCDLLLQKTTVKPKSFQCRGAGEKAGCSYAINEHTEKLGTNAPPDMVLLFETSSGWNQYGGPEMISAENHQGEGCNVLFSDGHVEFVKTKDIANLKWMPDKDP